ncbi:MAG: DUF2155 domain-containing protein [Emcibacter sp.]|nr:DUF2155 domain-containing protein [Emcibacter sp.]
MNLGVKGLIAFSLLLLSCANSLSEEYGIFESQEDISVVTLSALDKITTQLSTIEIKRDQTVRFGTLEITLRYCRKNPPEETPETVAFLEITDVGHNNQNRKVFSGWMFASSPALSPLEHPVYDVWVKDCKIISGSESMGKE